VTGVPLHALGDDDQASPPDADAGRAGQRRRGRGI
jgi:hypothetical protein